MEFDLNRAKTHILMKEKAVLNPLPSDSRGLPNLDGIWDFDKWFKNFKIKIVKYNSMEMEFDLIGIQTPVANAFRRILLSDVPSMAIEKVLVYNNTSLLQDEVLAHRLGLIPLKADPRQFEYKQEGEEEGTEVDTLKFELKVKCTWNRSIPDSEKIPSHERQLNTKVYTSHMKWIPIGSQEFMYKSKDVGPIHDDILIAKMVPGQEMHLELLAIKGIGRDHAKFSPVATAHYRLHPEITLTRDVEGDDAYRLQRCFSPGVIDVKESKSGKVKAVVKNARLDSCSRNVFRYDDLKDAVRLERIKNHFIFSIESVGALPPDELFIEAVQTLKKSCRSLLEDIENIRKGKKD